MPSEAGFHQNEGLLLVCTEPFTEVNAVYPKQEMVCWFSCQSL